MELAMRFLKRRFKIIVLPVIVVALVGAIGGALYLGVFSPHPEAGLDAFNGVYGTKGTRLDTCNTCHYTGRSTNSYGTHLKSELLRVMNAEAEALTEEQELNVFRGVLRGIEVLDSDDDGYSNLAEIRARTFPGDPGDHPISP